MSFILIVSYLFAIIAANNIVTYFGTDGLIVTGFLLIPFDLVARDALQEKWKTFVVPKMGSLILGGSVLAFLTNPSTLQVSLASAGSFLIAGTVDWIIYSMARNKTRFFKMNVSNLFSSVVDSCVFQIIAFGSFSGSVAMNQSFVKLIGGLFWSLLFVKMMAS